MKRGIFSILFALALVLCVSLVIALPAGANGGVPDRVTAITNAADRLVATQSTATLGLLDPPDYGWDWKITGLTQHSATESAYNMYGVVILGLLDAYGETDNASYLAAATAMADHMTSGDASNGDFYKQGGQQEPAGAYDYQFLMRYAEISGDSTYSDYAIALWNWNKANTAMYATPEALNDELLGWAGSDPGAASWQLAAYGMAIHTMGDDIFATGCADLIVADLDPETGQAYLVGDHMALAECLEFLSELDSITYSATIDNIITALVDAQQADGCWNDGYAGTFQDTAYPVRALAVYGGTEGLNATRRGAAWLVANQLGSGGWIDDSGGSPEEYSEQDAEGLRALVATEAPVTIGDKGYYSIQAAIDAALEGDTVFVAPGKYNEMGILIDKSLTVTSTSGDWHDTIIDDPPTEPVFEFAPNFDGNATISGFTITNGLQGIYINGLHESGTININNCFIHGNVSWGIGGGSLLGNIFINECIVADNGGAETGIALLYVDGRVEIADSVIGGFWDGVTRYEGNEGSGIVIVEIGEDGTVLINHNAIVGNTGDGIYVDSPTVNGKLTITNNTIGAYDYDLEMEEDGYFEGNGESGIHIAEVGGTGVVTIEGNAIVQNEGYGIDLGGGGLAVCGDVTINDNAIGAWADSKTVDGTVYIRKYGGNGNTGIYVSGVDIGGSLTIADNGIAENGSVTTGIHIDVTLGDTTISNNAVGSWTQDVPGVDPGVDGDPTLFDDPGPWWVATTPGGGTVINNGNEYGGLSVGYVPDGSLLIQDNNVSKNTNTGIGVTHNDEGDGAVTIDGNTIDDNGTGGNGIYLFDIDYATISGNTITRHIEGESWYCGVGLYESSYNNITDNAIKENWVGICINHDSSYNSVVNNDISDNALDGIVIDGDDNEILGNTISGNLGGLECGIYLGSDAEDNVINYNNITQNTTPGPGGSVGVYNDRTVDVDARWNWWGDASGPSGEGPGTGDAVSDYVLYDPWLGQQWTNQVWVDDDWQIEPSPPYAEDEDNDLFFATIQAAIDAVPPGTTINVAAGEYIEDVFIYKSLTLQGAGAGVTFISGIPSDPPCIVGIDLDGGTVVFDGFTVSEEEFLIFLGVVNGSSLTISNNILQFCGGAVFCPALTVANGSSVTVEDNEICYSECGIGFQEIVADSAVTIQNNNIHDNEGGIWLEGIGGGSTVAVQNNNIHDNSEGIILDLVTPDSTVAIVGNTIANNVGGEDTGIHIGPDVNLTKVRVNFNNITGNEDYGVYNHGTSALNAKHNWWGSVNGPGEDGANDVTGDVVYAPWLGVPVIGAVSGTVGPGGTLDASAEVGVTVGVTGGSATVTAAKYSGNPGSGSLRGSTGQYVDINLANVVGVTSIEIRVYYTQAELAGKVESSLRLQWWDGADWVGCTPPENSGVTYPAGGPTYRGYMWVKVTATSTPNLGDLEGTPFGGGGTAFVGGGGTVPPTTVSKVGSVSLLQYLDLQGKTRIKIILTSDDDVLTVIIFSATLVQNVGGNPLESMGIVTLSTPPPPPGYALVGHAYDCLPDGANFAPNVTMTFAYDPADIPDGASEADLLAAYWDGDEWVNMPTTVNAAANTATTGVGHFTPFALIAPLPPAAPAAFSVSNLSIQPAEVQPNEVVNITSSVANSGGSEGSYSVVLKINGATEAERSITLAAGESQDVSFSVTKAEAASYNVTIEGLSGSFTVVTPAAEEEAPEAGLPISWTLIWIIAAAVVVVGLIIFFAVRQRA